MDESIDVSHTTQLAAFFRGIDLEFYITEEIPALITMKRNTAGADFYELVQRYCKIWVSQYRNCLNWCRLEQHVRSVATVDSWFITNDMKSTRNRDLVRWHCLIHQENLYAKFLEMTNVTVISQLFNLGWRKWILVKLKISWVMWNSSTEMLCVILGFFAWVVAGCLNMSTAWSQKLNYFWKWRGKLFVSFVITTGCVTAFRIEITRHMNDLSIKLQEGNHLLNEMFDILTAFDTKLRLWELRKERKCPLMRKKKSPFQQEFKSSFQHVYSCGHNWLISNAVLR